MFSVVFLSAPVMYLLWASFLDLYCEDGVCAVESVLLRKEVYKKDNLVTSPLTQLFVTHLAII
jgi:hypothetical protein